MLICLDNQVSFGVGHFIDPTISFVHQTKKKTPSRANPSANGGGSDPRGSSWRQNANVVHRGGSA